MARRRQICFGCQAAWAALGFFGLLFGCGAPPAGPSATGGRGGTLVASVRSEPQTFNRLLARDSTSALVGALTQARLVRIDPSTDQVLPWLAEDWSVSADGQTYRLTLRSDVRFSDGRPFTSADVLFSFEAVYDDELGSPLGDTLRVGGAPLAVSALDDLTVSVTYPAPFGPGLRILDNLTILPAHRLAPALADGSLDSAWGVTASPEEIVGLGPFVLSRYEPGQWMIFQPNPEYWRRDSDGIRLPYLDRLVLVIVPDQNAEMLRLEAGEIDFTTTPVRAEDYASIERAVARGELQLFDRGVGLDADFLWFDLTPPDGDGRPWLRRPEFRRAIAHAVDRAEFADAVYLGLAEPIHGPVSPGNHAWFSPSAPRYEFDPERARSLLASLGLRDADGDGRLEDGDEERVRFTLLTQRGNTARERAASVLQADLGQIGVTVDVVLLEFGALIQRIMQGDYDAAYFGVVASDTDPAVNLDYWLSSGAFHPWNPGQATPATEWEAAIDALMQKQVASQDLEERIRLFSQVQAIFGEYLPALYFAAPHTYFATSARVRGLDPRLLRPHMLWNADSLYTTAPDDGAR